MKQVLIELSDIEKNYGSGGAATQVLKGISFNVQAGEYVAIMGGSGSGKTTLMNILGGLDKPTAGSYRFEAREMSALDDDTLSSVRNSKIGFVFQQFFLLERASALRNVMLPLIYSEPYPVDAEERGGKALTAVGLADRIHYRPSELSGGQQQRVAIARALITQPSLILADEPTGNLDQKSGTEILAIFSRLHQEGRTLIVVTHDRAVAEHAHRMLVLQEGLISEDRTISSPRDAQAG